jgi:S-adenosylmethionine/arginine decarboxylase-like enzyme
MKTLHGIASGFQVSSSLRCNQIPLLLEFLPFKNFVTNQSPLLGLKRSGEFYFNFADSGFAGITCFNGSHISIHTTPTQNTISFDIFMSDRLLNNINITEIFYRDSIEFFRSEVIQEDYASR